MGIQERKEREREQRKADIMDCAMKVFLAKGFINASMEEIAECVELSKATLYLYFKNKEEIILHVMNAILTKFLGYLEDRMSIADSPQEKIRMIGEAYLDFYSECHGQFLLLASQETFAGMDFSNLEAYHDYLNYNSKFWTVIIAPISQAVDAGLFPKDTNEVEIAIVVWSSIKGLMKTMDGIVQTITCPDYQKLVEENSSKLNDFQKRLYPLNYKEMLRNLLDAIILSYQK